MGLDLGAARIGVALSDPTGTIASPYEVLRRSGDQAKDHDAIAALVRDTGAQRVVVGLPLSLSGTSGPAAEAAQTETKALAARLDVPVESYDERLTTVTAQRALRGSGVRAKAQRDEVDKVAAAVMLQSWLERNRVSDG
jgi:putative holliday junction resolvase